MKTWFYLLVGVCLLLFATAPVVAAAAFPDQLAASAYSGHRRHCKKVARKAKGGSRKSRGACGASRREAVQIVWGEAAANQTTITSPPPVASPPPPISRSPASEAPPAQPETSPVEPEPQATEPEVIPTGPQPPPPAEPTEKEQEEAAAPRLFATNSPWNEVLPSDTPTDSSSSLIVGNFLNEVQAEIATARGPSISTASYGVSLYVVPADLTTTQVQLTSRFPEPALRAAFAAVPLPESAVPASGTDGHLVVWQPSTDRLWEFWRLTHDEDGWKAGWGGAIQHVASSLGTYGSTAWPGASHSWGASGSGLSIAGGLITFADLQRGRIDHALALGIPHVRSGAYVWPAVRSDGVSTDIDSMPEGSRLRLDPKLNLSAMRLPTVTRMLAEAAQRYGIIVRDGASNVTFYGQSPGAGQSNPYIGSDGLFGGSYPARLLASFPWEHLQLLQMDRRAPGE